MYFKDDEIEVMKSIFKRLDVTTIHAVQYNIPDNKFVTGRTIAIYNKWKKPICIFQNFEPLSPYRMKLLIRLSEKIPHKVYITYPREDLVRVGWKIEK